MIFPSKKLIEPSKDFHRSLPANFSQEHGNHFHLNVKYKCPGLYIYFFPKVYFLPDSTLFIFRIWPLKISFLYYKKRIRLHSIKGIISIQRKWKRSVFRQPKNAFLIIHDPWTQNYYHWMTQALPRLLLAIRTGKEFTLLLPMSHQSKFHTSSLHVLGVEDWVVFDDKEQYYEAHDLMYPTHDIQIGDYHDDLMSELSRLLRKPNIRQRGNYLFIHRTATNARKIVNEEEVLATFLSWGFSITNFETLSFEEQRVAAGQACILAGVHGAGLTNMLFMEPGSKILELTSTLSGEQYYYFTLSNALGHKYYYQLCKPDVRDKSIQEANLYVDISLLKANLELMIRGCHD